MIAGLADDGRGLGDLRAEPVEDACDLLGLVWLHGQPLGHPHQVGDHPADGLDRFDSGILAHHEPPRIVRTASMDVTWVMPPSRRGTSKPSSRDSSAACLRHASCAGSGLSSMRIAYQAWQSFA